VTIAALNPFIPSGKRFAVAKSFFSDLGPHILRSGVLDRYEGVKAKEPTLSPWGIREVHRVDPAGVCWYCAQERA
jgi:hypothetical protein